MNNTWLLYLLAFCAVMWLLTTFLQVDKDVRELERKHKERKTRR
jgi:hypothetical protein